MLSPLTTRFFVRIVWGFVLAGLVACAGAGGGGFSGTDKKKKASETKPAPKAEKSENAGETARSAPDGDRADEPVLITGTYLTCEEAPEQEKNDDQVAFGCRLASKASGSTVPLGWVAKKWSWSATKADGSPIGGVTVKQLAENAAFQVLYIFAGADKKAAQAVADLTKIVLDLDLLPEAGAGPTKQLGDMLTQILENNALGNATGGGGPKAAPAPGPTPTGAGSGGGGSGAVPAPTTAPGPGATPAPATGSGPIPATSGPTLGNVSPGTGPGPQPSSPVNPVNPGNPNPANPGGDTLDKAIPPPGPQAGAPTVEPQVFLTMTSDGATMRLAATVSGDGGATQLAVTDLQLREDGPFTVMSSVPQADGTALVNWRLPLTVTFRYDGKDCRTTGIPQNNMLTMKPTCE